MMRLSVVLVCFLLSLAFDCIAMAFEDVAKAQVIETGQLTKGMEDDKQEVLFDRTTNSIHTEWDAMLESIRSLEEDAKEVDTAEFKNTHLKIIRREIDQLNACHNLIHHIFGAPPQEIDKDSPNKPQIVWKQSRIPDYKGEMNFFLEEYKSTIWNILENVQIPMDDPIPRGLHHLQIACNNCIIQTIQFICRFKLAPHDMMEQIQSLLRGKPGLEWFLKASRGITRRGTKLDNEFNWQPYFEVHLKYHFQLFHFKQLFEDFSKKEQDWILFHYLLGRLGVDVEEVTLKDKFIEEIEWSPPKKRLIQLLRKLREFVGKGLEAGDHDQQQDSTENFFLDIKDILVQFREVIIEPKDARVYDDASLYGKDVITVLVLEFLHSRFGLDYVNSELFAENQINTLELRKKCDLLKFGYNNEVWKDMLLDYSHYLAASSKNKGQVKNVKLNTLEEKRKTFYWQMLKENLITYKRTKCRQFGEDPEWRKQLESNEFYKNLIDRLDSESTNMGKLFKEDLIAALTQS
ncbi:hypothetical protein H4Q26_016460 [Puccinia striiformis f. sp. tritici PST-130]|nr:hypothetical protein H4Q26_016460 [Puccinia striiformis f. sp. tritici PST-130]